MAWIILMFCAATVAAAAQTVTTLVTFDLTNGGDSFAGLVEGTDGNFYGTTAKGGANESCTSGCGTVFKITATGVLTTLHSFSGSDGASIELLGWGE
jgi:uncharacterized repeat protein (TIGR03803 family)